MPVKFWLWSAVLFLGLAALVLVAMKRSGGRESQVEIGGQRIAVEIADEPEEWERGLMGRRELAENSGMLFVFPDKQIRTFWMKDTLIPLDIIYIDDDRVVDMATLNPATMKDIPRYTSRLPANYVLELKAGSAKQFDLKNGDYITISLDPNVSI